MPSIEDIYEQAQQVVMTYTEAGYMVATAESCTGGLIAAALTDVAGSSAVLDRSFVTYSNAAKASMLGVSPDLIERVGAVSEEVALAMAQGALANSRAQVAISVTGIAGPGGGTADKPVGTIWFGMAKTDGPSRAFKHLYEDQDRRSVRYLTVETALNTLLKNGF
ncbi:MAG: CinA family protein [Pseudomonadota bacterium]